jgi:hypothetical protein
MSMALAAGEAEMSTVILPRWMMAALGLENDERVDLRKISPKTGPHYVAKEVRLVINSGTPHAHAPFHVLPFETLDSLRVGSSFVVADDESGEASDETDSDFSDEEDEDYSSEADDAESEGPIWDELEKRAYEDDRTAAQKRHQQNDEKDRGRRASRR